MTDTGFSLKLWPPSERTRAAVIERVVKSLSSPSILSEKYGEIDAEQAQIIASKVEEEAFAACQNVEVLDSGVNVLQFYSKEISRLLVDTAKSRAANQNSLVQSAIDFARQTSESAASDPSS